MKKKKKTKKKKQHIGRRTFQVIEEDKSDFEIIMGKIVYYQKLYGTKRTKKEYEIAFYLRALADLYDEEPVDSKYKNGETKIQLQEHLNDYLFIVWKLCDMKTNKNGYVNRICLSNPSFICKIKNIDYFREDNIEDRKKTKKELAKEFNKNIICIQPRCFASHIWIHLDNPSPIKSLYMDSEIEVSGKVAKYKGKIHNNRTRTEKYGLEDCRIENHSVSFPKINVWDKKDIDVFISRAGYEIFSQTQKETFIVSPDSFSLNEAVAINEDGYFKINKEKYDFYKKNNKTPEDLIEKCIEILNKHERLGIGYSVEKTVDK